MEKFSNATFFRQIALQNLQRKNLRFSETVTVGSLRRYFPRILGDQPGRFVLIQDGGKTVKGLVIFIFIKLLSNLCITAKTKVTTKEKIHADDSLKSLRPIRTGDEFFDKIQSRGKPDEELASRDHEIICSYKYQSNYSIFV